ncbi:MAG: NAD(P)H-hydrate dehydratase [Cyanobacteria bacterium J06597_16]
MPQLKPAHPNQIVRKYSPHSDIQSCLVTADQMRAIEGRLFEAGMPVAALMEKVSGRITQWFITRYSAYRDRLPSAGSAHERTHKIGILAGPGHNGGDALVVARELHHAGYDVCVYQPFERLKPLTAQHARYAKALGIRFVKTVAAIATCDAIIDGWFGFGLTRAIADPLAADINFLNQQPIPIFSIDLPTGIHTDTGQVMGTAIEASYTACLGLWKRGFMQADALAYLGECDLIDFDIPWADISAVLGESPSVQRLTRELALSSLPLHRSPTAHKYTAGHLLLIAGSRQYAGAALLAGLGAMASGVGMLTLAVPESIRLTLLPQLPGALLVGCSETDSGAIAQLPQELAQNLDVAKYDVIALGPGLTPTVPNLLAQIFSFRCPLLLDADGLNLLAQADPMQQLQSRPAPTVLTPHLGEFKRLFPDIHSSAADRSPNDCLPGAIALEAAKVSTATILLKGPRSAVASGQNLWFNPHSTPALARGGSGDVLTGLMGGLIASAAQSEAWKDHPDVLIPPVLGAVWWHSQAAIYASAQRTVLGVDPLHLAQALNPSLSVLSKAYATQV